LHASSSWQPANETERTLLAGIADPATCEVYADWLEECGDADRAEFLRAHTQLRTMKESDIRAIWLQDRLQILARNVDSGWRDRVVPAERVVVETVVERVVEPPPPRSRPERPRWRARSVEMRFPPVPSAEVPVWMRVCSTLAGATLVIGTLLYWLGV
jgi:uncharacterized protein (TIGR02996 family)